MKKKLILCALLLWAGKLLHDAGAPVTPAVEAGPGQATIAAGTAVLVRIWHGFGVYGSYVAAPAVDGMVEQHASTLRELDPAIRRAPAARRKRTLGVINRIEQLDSMAVERMYRGHPVAALKYSMQAGGLVDAVRDNLLEEALLK